MLLGQTYEVKVEGELPVRRWYFVTPGGTEHGPYFFEEYMREVISAMQRNGHGSS
jgi:hypothetical protein